MINELFHKWEDIRIVGSGGKNQLAIAESVFHGLGHFVSGKIAYDHFRAPVFFQLICQQADSGLGVSVDGGVSDHYAFRLHCVGRPDVVFFDIVCKVVL